MPASGVSQDRAIEAVLGIARMIAESAIHVGSSATWLHFGHNQRIRQRQVQQIGLDIYEGACGIALFLAAAGRISGDDRYRELAIAALEPVRCVLSKPLAQLALGATSGLGAFVYSFLRVGQ
jgi:lantibiotic modifying enzyme